MSKKQPKLTPWFPSDARPARKGVYEKKFAGLTKEHQYWDGEQWHYGTGSPEDTAQYVIEHGGHNPAKTPRSWRGLAEDPIAKTIRGIA